MVYTVLTPSFSSCACIDSITGVVKGSSCVGYAAVLGRSFSGRLSMYFTNTSGWCDAVACCAKKSFVKPRSNILGAPPAGST